MVRKIKKNHPIWRNSDECLINALEGDIDIPDDVSQCPKWTCGSVSSGCANSQVPMGSAIAIVVADTVCDRKTQICEIIVKLHSLSSYRKLDYLSEELDILKRRLPGEDCESDTDCQNDDISSACVNKKCKDFNKGKKRFTLLNA